MLYMTQMSDPKKIHWIADGNAFTGPNKMLSTGCKWPNYRYKLAPETAQLGAIYNRPIHSNPTSVFPEFRYKSG